MQYIKIKKSQLKTNSRSAMLLGISVFALGFISTAAHAQRMVPCDGTESRVVECKDFRGNTVADAFCDPVGAKPINTRPCTAQCDGGDGDGSSDPLVFDLDGNGISLMSAEDGVLFDIDNDGNPDQTGWVGSGDGLLAIDENGDGIINGQSELFGTEKKGAFAHLAESDSNNDGVINDQDAIWSHLRMWVDVNSDGVTDAGELKTLGELQMTSIDLTYDTVDEINAGNQVTGVGGFTRFVDGIGSVVSKVLETLFSFNA